MKNNLIFLSLIIIIVTSCQRRIADLTLVSTRNIDSSIEYHELSRYVTGKDRALHSLFFFSPIMAPNIEDAIDKAVRKIPNGEYMKNVVLRERYIPFLLFTIRTFKIEGDVWGKSVEQIKNGSGFKIGDKVIVQDPSFFSQDYYDGKVISLTIESVIVEYKREESTERNEFENSKVQKK